MMNDNIILPNFQYPLVGTLYETPFYALPTCFDELLALPQPELIADIELLIRHELHNLTSKSEEAVEEEQCDAVFHSLMLLGHLKSETSLPLILEIFKLSDEDLDVLFGDLFLEEIWSVLVLCGVNQMSVWVNFIKNLSTDNPYSAALIMECFEQVAVQFPEKAAEAKSHIADLLLFFKNLPDELFVPSTHRYVLGMLTDAAANLSMADTLPIIEALYKNNRVDWVVRGNWQQFSSSFNEDLSYKKALYLNVRDWYNNDGLEWEKRAIQHQLESLQRQKEQKQKELEALKREAQKTLKEIYQQTTGKNEIGRNALCPCGSGKKYKRCHGA